MRADANLAAAFAEREDFAGVERAISIEGVMNAAHEVEISVGKKKGHEFGLFHADAVLTGERPADFHAVTDDFGRGLHGAFELTFVARVVKNDGMKIAVAGVKNVADVEAVASADFTDATKSLREFGTRDNAVENVVAGGETAESTKSVFAAFPEKIAFGVVAGEAHFARVMRVADFGDGDGLGGDSFGKTFDFEKKNGGAVAWEARVDEVLDDAKRPAIEHFAGGGSDGASGNIHDSFRGVVHGVENGKKGLDSFGLAGKLDRDFRDERESAFGADEEAGQIVARGIALRAADANDFAVGENKFESGDVIGCDAVGKRVGTARVFGDVATDGAGFLAGRIGREIEAVRFGGKGEIVIHDAGLDDGALIFRVDRKNAVHTRENEHQSARACERTTREASARAATDDWHVVLGGEFDDLGDLLRGSGENDDFGAASFDGAIVLVEENVLRLRENGLGAEELFEIAKKARVHSWRPAGAAFGTIVRFPRRVQR